MSDLPKFTPSFLQETLNKCVKRQEYSAEIKRCRACLCVVFSSALNSFHCLRDSCFLILQRPAQKLPLLQMISRICPQDSVLPCMHGLVWEHSDSLQINCKLCVYVGRGLTLLYISIVICTATLPQEVRTALLNQELSKRTRLLTVCSLYFLLEYFEKEETGYVLGCHMSGQHTGLLLASPQKWMLKESLVSALPHQQSKRCQWCPV